MKITLIINASKFHSIDSLQKNVSAFATRLGSSMRRHDLQLSQLSCCCCWPLPHPTNLSSHASTNSNSKMSQDAWNVQRSHKLNVSNWMIQITIFIWMFKIYVYYIFVIMNVVSFKVYLHTHSLTMYMYNLIDMCNNNTIISIYSIYVSNCTLCKCIYSTNRLKF